MLFQTLDKALEFLVLTDKIEARVQLLEPEIAGVALIILGRQLRIVSDAVHERRGESEIFADLRPFDRVTDAFGKSGERFFSVLSRRVYSGLSDTEDRHIVCHVTEPLVRKEQLQK